MCTLNPALLNNLHFYAGRARLVGPQRILCRLLLGFFFWYPVGLVLRVVLGQRTQSCGYWKLPMVPTLYNSSGGIDMSFEWKDQTYRVLLALSGSWQERYALQEIEAAATSKYNLRAHVRLRGVAAFLCGIAGRLYLYG